jgi:hypothetical protein
MVMNVRLHDSEKNNVGVCAVKRRYANNINFVIFQLMFICCVLLLCRGYVEAVREIEQQIQLSGDVQFDDIVVACGRYFINTQYSLLAMG